MRQHYRSSYPCFGAGLTPTFRRRTKEKKVACAPFMTRPRIERGSTVTTGMDQYWTWRRLTLQVFLSFHLTCTYPAHLINVCRAGKQKRGFRPGVRIEQSFHNTCLSHSSANVDAPSATVQVFLSLVWSIHRLTSPFGLWASKTIWPKTPMTRPRIERGSTTLLWQTILGCGWVQHYRSSYSSYSALHLPGTYPTFSSSFVCAQKKRIKHFAFFRMTRAESNRVLQ